MSSIFSESKRTLLDIIFGSKTDVINLIKQNKWEEASKFGDDISYNAVINNEKWWWDQVNTISKLEDNKMNSTSYGNLAIGVFYGQYYSERINSINEIKEILEDVVYKC